MRYTRTITASWEPVTLDEARSQCRLVATDVSHPDDTYLQTLIQAAREKVEHDTKRCIVASDFVGYLDDFPSDDIIVIQQSPVSAVSKVEYLSDENWTEVSDDDYTVDTVSRPARIVHDDSWPDPDDTPNAVKVTFSAGYADQASVPQMLKHMILLLVAHWYDARQPVVTGISVSEVPVTYADLVEINEIKYF